MIYTYDGTFVGVLSVIFETYRLRQPVENILVEDAYQPGLFGAALFVKSQPALAERVIERLSQQCGDDIRRFMYHCFLSEQEGIEMMLYRMVRLAVDSSDNISDSILANFREPVIRQLHRIERQMHREIHRMHAFVRFQETKDGLYVALISPDFNVLPLLGPHFQSRYPYMRWLIYDRHRRYGLYYETQQTRYVTLDTSCNRLLSEQMLMDGESDYQTLWKTYYQSVDIPERKNLKLHLRHVPKRYWKYLIEKQDRA